MCRINRAKRNTAAPGGRILRFRWQVRGNWPETGLGGGVTPPHSATLPLQTTQQDDK